MKKTFFSVVILATLLFAACKTIDDNAPEKIGVKINGVVWAPYNVAAFGTFAATPESAGKFYQWNRKTAWTVTGGITGWDSTNDKGNTWTAANDPCPKGWRVPTWNEFRTFYDADEVELDMTTFNSIDCLRVSDKKTGKTIFLPAIGGRDRIDGSRMGEGAVGYWSSTEDNDSIAYALVGGVRIFKAYGLSVRCVAE